MFSWPKTIVSGGAVTVTARHWTPGTKALTELLVNTSAGLTMVGSGIAYYYYHTYRGQLVDKGGLIVVSCIVGVLAAFPSLLVMGVTRALCAIFLYARTTVRISGEAVRVAGTAYPRGNATIQFTNLFPQSLSMGSAAGGNVATIGGIQETAGLRMFYGSAAVLVTTFRTAEHASKFALACNAALHRVNPPPHAQGLSGLSVTQLYQSGQVVELPVGQPPPALPSAGSRGGEGSRWIGRSERAALPSARKSEDDMRAIVINSTTAHTRARAAKPSVIAVLLAVLIVAAVAAAAYFHAQVGAGVGNLYKVLLGTTTAGSDAGTPPIGYVTVTIAALLGLTVCFGLIVWAATVVRRLTGVPTKGVVLLIALLTAAAFIGGRYQNEMLAAGRNPSEQRKGTNQEGLNNERRSHLQIPGLNSPSVLWDDRPQASSEVPAQNTATKPALVRPSIEPESPAKQHAINEAKHVLAAALKEYALIVDPKRLQRAEQNIAEIRVITRDFQGALEIAQQLTEPLLGPSQTFKYSKKDYVTRMVASYLAGQGRMHEAIAVLRNADVEDVDHQFAAIVINAAKDGKVDDAEAALHELPASDDKTVGTILAYRAGVQVQTGNIDEASRTLAKIVDPMSRQVGIRLMARGFARRGKIAEAKQMISQMDFIKSAYQRQLAILQVAMAQAAGGSAPEAINSVRNEFAGKRNIDIALRFIAVAQMQARDVNGAKQTLSEIKTPAEHVQGLSFVAKVQAWDGDVDAVNTAAAAAKISQDAGQVWAGITPESLAIDATLHGSDEAIRKIVASDANPSDRIHRYLLLCSEMVDLRDRPTYGDDYYPDNF